MNKLVVSLFLMFLVFGISVNSPILLAEEENDVNASVEVDIGVNHSDDSDDDNEINDTENDDEEDDEEDEEKERDENVEKDEEMKEKIKERLKEANCTIKIEKSIEIKEGKRVEVIKRKIECLDGTKEDIKIRLENRTIDGRLKESIKYEIRGKEIEVDTEGDIDLEEETNATHYRLKVKASNGNVTYIIIMPDQASEIVLERLKALNFTVELKEIEHKNIPRVVYNIESNKSGKFLGVFKLKMKLEGQVDPETGELIAIHKPWWAFLVRGEDSDQTNEDDSDDEDENDSDDNETDDASLEAYFTQQMRTQGAVNINGTPIEGFTPDLYMMAFPGLIEEDFDGVSAYGGEWEINSSDELEFIVDPDQTPTSAEGTVNDEGMIALLENLEERLDIEAESNSDIDLIIEEID